MRNSTPIVAPVAGNHRAYPEQCRSIAVSPLLTAHASGVIVSAKARRKAVGTIGVIPLALRPSVDATAQNSRKPVNRFTENQDAEPKAPAETKTRSVARCTNWSKPAGRLTRRRTGAG